MTLKIIPKNKGQLPEYFWIGLRFHHKCGDPSFRFGRCLWNQFKLFTAEFY